VTWAVLDYRTGTKAYTSLPETRGVEIGTKLKFFPDVVLPEPFVSGGSRGSDQGDSKEKEGFSTVVPAVAPAAPRPRYVPSLEKVQFLRFRPLALASHERSDVHLSKIMFFNNEQLVILKGARAKTLYGTDRLIDRRGAETAPAVLDYTNEHTYWSDNGLGVLAISLPSPAHINAFTMIAGPYPGAAPVKWLLEGSLDGLEWVKLHEQVTEEATAPTAPFGTYLIYPFDTDKDVFSRANLFEKSLEEVGKACWDPDILETAHTHLALQNPPALFSPVTAQYNGNITNSCTYEQDPGLPTLDVSFTTKIGGYAKVKKVTERPGAPARPAAAPAVAPAATRRTPSPPLEKQLFGPGFGLDSARNNQALYNLDDLYEAPLKQDIPAMGATGPSPVGSGPYKFIRFRPLKVRNPNATSVAMGPITFWRGAEQLQLQRVKMSNPMGTWKGDWESYKAQGWTDRAMKPLVFAFTDPVSPTGYSWTTSFTESMGSDPVRWKLEGSSNGVYWTVIHEQMLDFDTPRQRGKAISVLRF